MVTLVSSAFTCLTRAKEVLTQTPWGHYILCAAATHWNLPFGFLVGYGINAQQSLANYRAVGITLVIAAIYLGGISALAGVMAGASVAGRDLGLPVWLIPIIDFLGQGTIVSALMPLGTFTIGMPLPVRCFIGTLAYAGYAKWENRFTYWTATLGLITLHACTGTAGVVTFIGLLYLRSPVKEPKLANEEPQAPSSGNFSTHFDFTQAFRAFSGGKMSPIEELEQLIKQLKEFSNHRKKQALIIFANRFHDIAKEKTKQTIHQSTPNINSTSNAYNQWSRAWLRKIHPDKNQGADWADPLTKILNSWTEQVEALRNAGLIPSA